LTEPGQVVVKHDVTIASPLNLPATMPEHASELYSKNVTALLDLLVTDGTLAPDFDDEVIADSCVTRETGAGDDAERSDAEERRETGAGDDAERSDAEERRETVGED
jgi:NAD(P) transhydrogenase subunit alpha